MTKAAFRMSGDMIDDVRSGIERDNCKVKKVKRIHFSVLPAG